MAARKAACNGCWTMKRALVVALLAGLAVGPVLYLVDLELDRRFMQLRADGSWRSVRRRDESFSRAGGGRVDEILPTGVYPSSDDSAPYSARAQGMTSWGQGPRGASGYEDSGGSELSGLE
jgi:hypothetical protein